MENKNTNFDILELLEFEHQTQDLGSTLIQETNQENILETLENNVFSEENQLLMDVQSVPEDTEDILENISIESSGTHSQAEKLSFGGKLFGGIVFFVKYISTSAIIFLLLLSASNYSAYIEIARSYLNPELLEQNKNALLSSVNGAQFLTAAGTGEIVDETTVQKVSSVKNKTYHSMDKLLNGTYDQNLNMQIEITPYENRIVIPKIGKNIPLVDVSNKTVQNVKELENVFMKELENGIVRYPGSAKPGEAGNSFIFGHSSNFPWMKGDYNDVFALLDNVVFGDEVIVYYNQKKYVYKIREKNIIKPGDVSVLKRNTGKAEISLMTCWPVGTTLNRMIVVGELISQ